MWLIGNVFEYLRWFFGVSSKVFKANLFLPSSAILLHVVSQLSLILSFFLPLKVVILLGSEGVPWYFEVIFSGMERESLVLLLSFSSLLFFTVFVFSKWFSGVLSNRGGANLSDSAQKLALFESQDQLVKIFYLKLCESWGGILFVGLALIFGCYFYLKAFLFLMGFIAIWVLVLSVIGDFQYFRKRLAKNSTALAELSSGLSFIAYFGFIVYDFLSGHGVNLIYAIVSILLGRQFVLRLASVFSDAGYLLGHKVKIDSLFNANAVLMPSERGAGQDFWGIMSLQERNFWLKDILKPLVAQPITKIDSNWFQLRGREVVGLRVESSCIASQACETYLVKIYGPLRTALATHEATLLGESWSERLPAPLLKSVQPLENKTCLVFEEISKHPESRKVLKQELLNIQSQCWAVEPSPSIVDQYARSKPTLPMRLLNVNVDRLSMAAESAEKEALVMQYEQSQSEIVAMLVALPVFILNPNVRTEDLMVTKSGTTVSVGWSHWAVEPIGAGWPITEMPHLANALSFAAEARSELGNFCFARYLSCCICLCV